MAFYIYIMIHFALPLVTCIKSVFTFIFFACGCWVFQHYLPKELYLLIVLSAHLSEINWLYLCECILELSILSLLSFNIKILFNIKYLKSLKFIFSVITKKCKSWYFFLKCLGEKKAVGVIFLGRCSFYIYFLNTYTIQSFFLSVFVSYIFWRNYSFHIHLLNYWHKILNIFYDQFPKYQIYRGYLCIILICTYI